MDSPSQSSSARRPPPRKPSRSSRAPALTGIALVITAGVLAVWRPWSDLPEGLAPAEAPLTAAQQAAIAASQILSQRLPVAPMRERPTLMIRPFRATGGDAKLTYLGAGIASDLIQLLSRQAGIGVIGTDTSLAFANGGDAPPPGIKLKFRLEGVFEFSAKRLMLNVRLIEPSDDRLVWEERWEGSLAELRQFEAALTDRIVHSMSPSQRRRDAPPAAVMSQASIEALTLTYSAQFTERSTDASARLTARQLLEQARAIQPEFLEAHLALYRLLTSSGHSKAPGPERTEPRLLLEIASKAVSIAPTDPLARAAYADSLTHVGQHGTAVAQIEASLGSAPASSEVLRLAARVMERSGEHDKAVAFMQRALHHDPLIDPSVLAVPLASALYQAGRYQEAADYTARCLQRVALHIDCLIWRAASLAQTGASADSREPALAIKREHPTLQLEAYLIEYASSQHSPEAAKHLAEGLRKAGIIN